MNPDVFEGPFVDEAEREIFVFTMCPPLGRTRINIGTTAIVTKLDFSEPDSEGKSKMILHAELDPNVANESLAAMQPLWKNWDVVWPKVYDAIITIRREYGSEEPITASNAKIKISPPGDYTDYVLENWSCGLEIEPWDGVYDVEFQLDGAILDSGVAF